MIKASFESIQQQEESQLVVRRFELEAFTAPYHFHPEYELTLILKGEGKRYVGNHLDAYYDGDLCLLGSNLPHCWRTEPVVKGTVNAISLVVHFTPDFAGTTFMEKPALAEIRRLLQKSMRGIRFPSEGNDLVRKKMMALLETTNQFERLLILLELLHALSLRSDVQLLDADSDYQQNPSIDQHRINPVLAYIIDNFREEVSLAEAARLTNMTTNAFCKYFKKITRKTFMELVIEYRLNYATTQLVQTDKPISHICFESGFNDSTHFSRIFKSRMKATPLQYRQQFRKEMASL